MKCWICGDEATTGEHLAKASDLKSEFGVVTQKSPIYCHTDEKLNVKINSIKRSPEIKSKALLCANCNNARSAPFDKAWEKLSASLRGRSSLRAGSIIRLEKVFPGSTSEQMLNVHLFFVKCFGCAIKEFNVPIDIQGFSESILNMSAHPKVHITFGASNGAPTGRTNLETANIGERCMFATWFYIVGKVAVNVMYAEPQEKRKGLKNSWHPTTVTKRLKLANYQI